MNTTTTLSYTEQKPMLNDRRQLVVLLHGYGSNKDDLISITPELSTYLPNAHFISPNAPQAFEGGMENAYQWFSLLDRSEESLLHGARAASIILEEFLQARLLEFGINIQQLALVGFSQGAMLALHCGLRMAQAPKALLCYSGMLIAPSLLQAEIKSYPNVMLIHGTSDDVVPFGQMVLSEKALKANKVPVMTCKCSGLGHGIDMEGINAGGEFLKNMLC